jgi:preprotein translocase subunit YajC
MWCPDVTQLTDLTTGSIVAGGGAAQNPGLPFDPFLLIMLLIFGFLIFSMFRRSKKAQHQQQELRSSLAPGVEVMTTMGLFGTIVSVDTEENKAVIELSPGTTATVHLQAIGKAVEPAAAAPVEAASYEAPDYRDGATGDSVPDSPAALDDTPRRPEDTGENGPDDQRPEGNRP